LIKGALAGGVGAMAVMGATLALAGTGVGGVFNLGQTNQVNATSTLTGGEGGPGLSIKNTSSAAEATALSLTSAGGHAPLAVNSQGQVANLNSNYLQGYTRSELNRVGLSSNEDLFGIPSTETDRTVTIAAPAAGFVKVEGSLVAEDAFSAAACTRCIVVARLHDDDTGTYSPVSVASFGTGTTGSYASMSLEWVFRAAKGSRSYSLTTAQSDTGGPASIDNPVLTAQFVPFGSTGSPASLAGTLHTSTRTRSSAGQPVWHGR
jgi:hypothetical protein